jgi:hypothetical protein
VAERDGDETEHNGQDDVSSGPQKPPLASEFQCLKAEGRKARASSGTGRRPSMPVKVAKNPMISDPKTLIRMVP